MGNSLSSADAALFKGYPPVTASDFEASTAKRDRTLKHLLKANHHDFAVMFHHLQFHNHLSHALGSAYLLGATAEHLQALYDKQSKGLDRWEDSPHEIGRHDWRDYLGDRTYQRAYLDFFEDELVRLDYDWRKVVAEYMLGGPKPLIYGGIGGLGHPLIHLGYAFELNSREVAMEALVLSATNYNFLHKYIDNDSEVQPAKEPLATPLEILAQIRADSRFDGLFDLPGANNMSRLFELREKEVLEYYHKLPICEVAASHRELTKAATLMLCATHKPGHPQYDFFICHLLTTAYAIRILLPELPNRFASTLVKAHWLFFVVVYCVQLRPAIRPQLVDEVDVGGKSWDDVVKKVLCRDRRTDMEDTHYLKAIRTLLESAKLWKEEDIFYQKAAVKFAWEFTNWSGFGTMEEE